MGLRLSVLLHTNGPPSATRANCNSRRHPLSSPSLLLQLPQSLPSPLSLWSTRQRNLPDTFVGITRRPPPHRSHSAPLLSSLPLTQLQGLLWFLLIMQSPHSKSSLELSQASRKLPPEELEEECAYSFLNSSLAL